MFQYWPNLHKCPPQGAFTPVQTPTWPCQYFAFYL